MSFFRVFFEAIFTKQLFYSIITIISATFIIKIIKIIISRILITGKTDFEIKRRNTIINLFSSIFKYLIYIIAVLIILDFYGINTKSVMASLGIVGAMLGLALQDTIKDLISGISLILENYLAVGDIVTFNGFTGEVIELGLRVTKIKAYTGEVMIIANHNIDTIVNSSQKKANVVIEIDTAYEEKTEKVEQILTKVIDKAIKDNLIYDNSSYIGINELSAHSVKYLISVYCNQANRHSVRREILKRIKLAYDDAKLKIPYNQIEVHHGQDL